MPGQIQSVRIIGISVVVLWLILPSLLSQTDDAFPGVLPPKIDPSPHEAGPALEIGSDAWLGDLEFDAEAGPASLPSLSTSPATRRPRYSLPPVEQLIPPRALRVATIQVREFAFDGNTIFTDQVLRENLDSYLNRPLTEEDLDQARADINRHFSEAEYVNSGATRDYRFEDGVLTFQIVEGRLTDIVVERKEGSPHRLRNSYLTRRIFRDRDAPLNFKTLQQRLQVLQGDPNIERINAELKPGAESGESILNLEVEELNTWSYGVDFHNYRPPSSGAEQIDLWLRTENLSGVSDSVFFRYGLLSDGFDEPSFSGFDNLFGLYERPLFADDTTLVLRAEKQDYLVIDDVFEDLNIKGETWRLAGGLRRPIYRSFNNEKSIQDNVSLSLMLERSHSETSVLGRLFTISPGAVDGELDLTILRFGQEWTRRTSKSVLALRNSIAIGLDAFDATERSEEPDSQFMIWNLYGQFLRRMNTRGHLLVVNGGIQIADDPLPSPEQLTLGGRYTVRGYRENTLVRDNGAFGSIEYRIPLYDMKSEPNWKWAIAPFFDAGYAWNDNEGPARERDSEHLLSAGLGLRLDYRDWLRGELYWGIDLHEIDDRSDNLQDDGIHFKLTVAKF